MLQHLAKRWRLGWLLLLNLWVTSFLIGSIMFFAFTPAIVMLSLTRNDLGMDESLRTILRGLRFAYALTVSPIALPWIVRWKGLPVWTLWDGKGALGRDP